MSDNTEQSDLPVESETQEAEVDPLEKIYEEYDISGEAQEFTAQPAPAYQPPAQGKPDDQVVSNLYSQLTDVQTKFTQMQQNLESQKVEADIGKAVSKISEKVEGVEPHVLEAYLEGEAGRDPRFKALWDNRGKNPKAWEKGLEAFSSKIASKFSVKTDPNLAESQRALKTAQQASATTSSNDDDPWSTASEAEFDAMWNRLKKSY